MDPMFRHTYDKHVGNCTSHNGNQEPRISGSEIEIDRHEKTEEDNNAWRLLVYDVPINECGHHAEKRTDEVACKLKQGGTVLS